MTPFQLELHELAFNLGAELDEYFKENFLENWPDEESTTAALFGAMAILADRAADKRDSQRGLRVKLTVEFSSKKREAVHGADVFIRFHCSEPEWHIATTTVIQAKRVEPFVPMSSRDHERLSDQLGKMLNHTTESFVLLYSETEGIKAVPAVACRSLRSKQPFDLDTISWQWFLSGIFRGRMGESNRSRLPGRPWITVNITAEEEGKEPIRQRKTAGG